MNSFELNKILGALLGTCLILVAMHIAAGALFTPEKPAKPGYEVAVKEEQPKAGAAPAAPAAVPKPASRPKARTADKTVRITRTPRYEPPQIHLRKSPKSRFYDVSLAPIVRPITSAPRNSTMKMPNSH